MAGFPSNPDADPDDALDEISREAEALIHHLRCASAPAEALAQASEHIRQAVAAMAPWLRQGKGWSVIGNPEDSRAYLTYDKNDLTAHMPFSPISGRHNPVAPPLKVWAEGGEVHGKVVFSPLYAGPPDTVHGGVIAAVFDELLALANVVGGRPGVTGYLRVRYHRPMPLNTPIELWAVNERQSERKQVSRAEMRVDGQVIASAEGLFISVQRPAAPP